MAVPQPRDRDQQPPVPRARPRHGRLHPLHRQLEPPRHRPRGAPVGPQRRWSRTSSTTISALASQQTALGQSIQRLPRSCALANTTFVNLRNSLTTLNDLVNVSKPDVLPTAGYPNGRLQALLTQLKPLAIQAVPTIKNLANIIGRPGPNNDLIDLNNVATPLARATVGGEFGIPENRANGAQRPGAFVVSRAGAGRVDPRARDRAPVRRRPDRLVRGLLASGRDRRQRRRQPDRARPSGSARSTTACSTSLPSLLNNPGLRQAFSSERAHHRPGRSLPGSMERGPQPGTSAGSVPRIGLPLQPEPGANRKMRRILVSAGRAARRRSVPSLHAGGLRRQQQPHVQASSSTTRSGSSTGADFKVAGVISGSITSIDLCYTDPKAHCQNPLARAGDGAGERQGLRPVPLRRVLPVAAAVADRRVLHRLRARLERQGAAAGLDDHRQPHAVDDPGRPASRTSCGCRYRERFSLIINELGAAVAARSEDLQTALRRADPALAADRQPAGAAGQRRGHDPRPQRQRRHGDHGAGQELRAGPAVHRRGQPHVHRLGDAGAGDPGDVEQAARVPAAAASRRCRNSAPPPTRRSRCSRT